MKLATPLVLASLLIGVITVVGSAAQLLPSEDVAGTAERASNEAIESKQKEEPTQGNKKHKAAYAVVSISVSNGQWAAIRYQKDTGKSWNLGEGKWVAIKELKQLRPDKPSAFEIQIMSAQIGLHSAIRIDKNSGQCWELKEDTWHPILDDAD